MLDTTNVDENVTNGHVVGEFTTIDSEVDDTFTYTLNYTNGPFVIVDNKLKTNGQIDYETKSSYTIRATTNSNNDSLTYTKDFTISVNDVNEPPTNLTLSNNNVDENKDVGTLVGTFTTIDQDTNNTYTYTLNTSSVPFEIDSSGNLRTTQTLDFESDPTSYSINVISNDGSYNIDRDFTIYVNDVIEFPSNITLSNNVVLENVSNGTEIGTFTTIDQDANNTFAYTLNNVNDVPFVIIGDKLKTSGDINYEIATSYTINVTTTDNTGLTFTKDFIINVTDENEGPTDLSLNNTNVDENMAIGTVVGTFTTTDEDANSSFTYTINTENVPFEIVGDQLKTTEFLDHETNESYIINVTTTDNTGLTFTKDITIVVNDVNEVPTNLLLDNTEVNEDVTIGHVVGTFTTTDVDADSTFTYTLNNVNDVPFEIVVDQLKTTELLDYETTTSYNINVTTTDNGGLIITKDFVITVIDINEQPTDIILSNNNVNEDVAIEYVVGTFTTTDVDANSTFTYTLNNVNNVPFEIVGDQLKTTELLDYEAITSYTINVTTTDNGNLTFTKDFTIIVNNVSQPPRDIILSNNRVSENQVAGTIVGTFESDDPDHPDPGNTFTYTLNTTNVPFEIVGNELMPLSSIRYQQFQMVH